MQSASQQHNLNKYIDAYNLKEHLNDDLLSCLRVYHFEPQQAVFTALTEQTHLYFLVEGKAQISYYLANGKRSIIMIITPFSIVGDMEIFDDDEVQLNVITTEASILLGIRKADVLQYGYDDAPFLRFIIRHMSAKLRDTGFYQLASDMPLINRVSAYLLGQPMTDNQIAVESKTLIADFLSTTPRHLNRVIKLLEDDQIIRWERGKVIILDLSKLESCGEL